MHSNASINSQVGDMLAITLPNNANLEEGTLTNAKLHIISLAETRALEVRSATRTVFSVKAMEKFESIVKNV